jgi:ASC-1-like (ASCH) protein
MKKKHINKNENKLSYNKMDVTYIEHISEPWFSLISLGLKTVEGRKNKGKFKEMNVGDIIEWTNEDFDKRTVLTKITKKVGYDTFAEYLNNEGLENCLPGMPSLEHGLSVYFKYFTKQEEKDFGVIAIHLELIK